MVKPETKLRKTRDWSYVKLWVFVPALALVAIQTTFLILSEKSDVSHSFESTGNQIVENISQQPSHRDNYDEYDLREIDNTTVTSKHNVTATASESETRVGKTDENTAERNQDSDINPSKANTPYELRQPERTLPLWAKKIDLLQNVIVPHNKEMCLVHIGNTAGSNIGCALGFKYSCSTTAYVNSLLARYTTHLFHNNINDCPFDATKYLVIVRHPLDRIQSAHVNERRVGPGSNTRGNGQNMIYEECGFTTLNDLAEKGLAINGKSSAMCKQRARKHIRGEEQYSFHTFYNYQYYYRNLNNSSTFYVIRIEHMIDDLNQIESMVSRNEEIDSAVGGKRRSLKKAAPASNPTMNYVGDDYLSLTSRRFLCDALCEDIQWYKRLLREAVNLDENSVAESLEELASSCPREARVTNCSETELYGDLSTSPFEVRWPGYILPTWAQKIDALRNLVVPEDKTICFVHVGKTAGSTMGSLLGFREYGFEASYTEGLLSRYTTHLFHNGFNDCQFNTTRYLFSVRHPLDRIKSSFIYERPRLPSSKRGRGQGKIHEECPFRTLNDLAELGLAKSGNASDLCKQRAYNFIRGKKQFGFHAFYNYQYYYNSLDFTDNSTIFVVRTEHLLEDWNTIEWMLGGERESMKEFQRVNPSQQLAIPGDDYLSEKAQELLCEGLCEEIQMYKKLLNEAVNLNEEDVAKSIFELAATCPREVKLHSCKSS